MKIQPGMTSIAQLLKTNIDSANPAQNRIFEKNQLIEGKILSAQGNELDILLTPGLHIKASTQGSINLPLDVPLTFEVLDNTGDMLLLRPAGGREDAAVPKERILTSLAVELGLKPTPDNLSFLEKCKDILSRSIERLVEASNEHGNMNILSKLQDILVSPEKLAEYLKGFEQENMEKLVKQLNDLFSEIKKDGSTPKTFTREMENLVKGFAVQVNHPFPLFYIPVPLIVNNMFYPGEIWIEKDAENKSENKDSLSVYISLETPELGRIEAGIKGSERDIALDLYCKNEVLPLFKSNLNILRDRITALGVNVKSVQAHELLGTSNFISLIQKYVKPFPSVDIKI